MTEKELHQSDVPSIHREIKVQEKRMRTLEQLEGAVNNFATELKDALVNCPIGHDSIQVQQAVNSAITMCTDYTSYLVDVFNYVTNQHSQDMEILAEHEHLVDSEQAEDVFALLKSHVTQELAASREVRGLDEKRKMAFAKRLKQLEEEYLTQPRAELSPEKTGNFHSSLVE